MSTRRTLRPAQLAGLLTILLACLLLLAIAAAGPAQARVPDAPLREIGVDEFIILATAGEGGAIEPAGEIVVPISGSQTFTITPDPGHHIAQLQVDGAPAALTGPDSYTFEDVQANHTIAVEFAVDTFTITPSVVGGAAGHGSINPSTPQTVAYGGSREFTFTPDTGYHVAEVRVDGAVVTPGGNQYTFEDVQANH
ncbi:MAG: hypothetical protein GX624_10345, partial [Actinobacteria bacterium]|nr:hypothetical protein [Actinomycetota bacterium]